MHPARAFAAALALLLPSFCTSFTFTSSPATDLEPLFQVNTPWLGADIATSFSHPSSDLLPNTYIWLHGDTLIGTMEPGPPPTRNVKGMPRNSVAIMNVSSSTGQPLGPYTHYIKTNSSIPSITDAFFMPVNTSQWYWPTAGISINGSAYILAYRTEDAGSGLFPFATAGIDVLRISPGGGGGSGRGGEEGQEAGEMATSPVPLQADPMTWPEPEIFYLPNINNSFNIGAAIAVADENGLPPAGVAAAGGSEREGGKASSTSSTLYLYLLGSSNQDAIMSRIPLDEFAQGIFDNVVYWASETAGSPPSWLPFSSSSSFLPYSLFQGTISETTMIFHEYMQLWYIIDANTFLFGSNVAIRTAPVPTGPWSEPILVYTIPEEQMAGGVFCYAGKAHPEFNPPANPPAQEFVFSYMCNTPAIPELLNRTDIYVPQLVRTKISQ